MKDVPKCEHCGSMDFLSSKYRCDVCNAAIELPYKGEYDYVVKEKYGKHGSEKEFHFCCRKCLFKFAEGGKTQHNT